MSDPASYMPLAMDEKLPSHDQPLDTARDDPRAGRPPSIFKTKPLAVAALALVLALPLGYLLSCGLGGGGSGLAADAAGGGAAADVLGSKLPPACVSAASLPTTAPKANVWANLDIPQAVAVRKWLFAPEQGLNLTRNSAAADSDNVVFLIEASIPPKDEVLAYFDEGGLKPDKYAHAVVHHGSAAEPYIQDYLIGPLPISNATRLAPLRDIYHVDKIPFHGRGFAGQMLEFREFIQGVMAPLEDASMDLFGAVSRGFLNDTLIAGGTSPASFDGEWRRMWLGFKLNRPGSYLFPIDLYIYVDISGTDSSKWHLRTLVYDKQVFRSTADFVESWKSGTLKRSAKPEVGDKGWADRSRKGGRRDLDHLAGPRSVAFSGPRFRVDQEQNYFSWMGWSAFLSFERDMGLGLWDIKFRGERIIYELTPQEALAQYSGNDPHQASTTFLDRAFGMGSSVKELIRGYDCPADAQYLPMTVHEATGSSTRLNAVCIFERESGRPLSRHTGWLPNEMGAVKGYELVVRSVSTVGNYDYTFETVYMLDGTMEVRISASGYLQGAVFDENQTDFGHRIRDHSMGSLHDHVIGYKVDFDIAGRRNSFMDLSLEMEDREEPWFEDDWGSNVRQQVLKRTMVKNEDHGRLDYHKNGEGLFVVTNEDAKNRWGNPRGYAIHPGESPIHLTNLDSKRTLKNAQWAKNHVSVCRRKDTEPYSSSMWNIHLPGAPPVDFDRFFDGESIEQEDLVTYISLGMHHIPRAEDSPHTLTNIATSSVLLTPFNFNDYDVGMEAMNAIVLQPPDAPDGLWTADENSVQPDYCLPAKPSPFQYTGLLSYDDEGLPASFESMLEARMIAEGVHGIWGGVPVA